MKSRFFTFCLLLCFSAVFAQKGSVSGKVTSSDGKPAEFITVVLVEIHKGVMTNAQGAYVLQDIEPGSYTLQVSMMGLETKKQSVEVKGGETATIDFSLKETSTQLKEVVIQATASQNERPVRIGKVPIRPFDLPQSIATIDREVLEQQQVQHLGDALKNANGVYMMGTTGGYQEEIAGRGFAFGSSNTFKNGVRFNNAAMPEMSALERVEIMKGSTAILFGNVAAGGIINLVTKKPLFEQGGQVSFLTGSYDLYKPYIDVYGSLNKNKTAAYRMNTSFEKARSFRDNVKSERYYVNPSLLFKLGSKTELLVEADYLEDNRTCDFGVGAINYELIDVPRERFLGVAWSYVKTEQLGGSATLTHNLSKNWQIRSVTAYQSFKNDLFANQRPNGNNQFIKADGKWIRGLQRTAIDEEYYITQLDLTGKFSTGPVKHTFLFGMDGDKYLTNTLAYNPVAKYDSINVFDLTKYKQRNDIPNLTPRTLTTTPLNRTGVYVQDLISITPKIKFLAGVRLSYLETFSNVLTYSTSSTVITRQFDNAWSPRLGLVYQPIGNLSLFASYANSFTPNSGVDINGNALKPSVIDQYEAGFKSDLFRGLFTLNATAYQIINSNLAQTSLENGNTNTNIKELAGEVTSQGIELDLGSRSWNGFSFIGGYSFNETKYTKSNTYIEGSRLRYNPGNTANGSLYYNFSAIRPLKGLNAGVSVLYFGERAAGRSTRVTVANDTYKLISIPAFTQLDASIGYTLNSVSIKIKVSNLLDELSYHVHDDNSVNPIAPRIFSGSVSYKF